MKDPSSHSTEKSTHCLVGHSDHPVGLGTLLSLNQKMFRGPEVLIAANPACFVLTI